MIPLTKITLDWMASHDGATPDCTLHKHDDTFYLRSRCHPEAPVEVSYEHGSGILKVTCAICYFPIAKIQVAPRALNGE
jgi:hypothetical protein